MEERVPSPTGQQGWESGSLQCVLPRISPIAQRTTRRWHCGDATAAVAKAGFYSELYTTIRIPCREDDRASGSQEAEASNGITKCLTKTRRHKPVVGVSIVLATRVASPLRLSSNTKLMMLIDASDRSVGVDALDQRRCNVCHSLDELMPLSAQS